MSGGDLTPASYVHTSMHSYQHPWEVQQSRSMHATYHHQHQQQMQMYQKKHPGIPFNTTGGGTDLVPIQVWTLMFCVVTDFVLFVILLMSCALLSML